MSTKEVKSLSVKCNQVALRICISVQTHHTQLIKLPKLVKQVRYPLFSQKKTSQLLHPQCHVLYPRGYNPQKWIFFMS